MSPPDATRLDFPFSSQSWSAWWQGTCETITSFLKDVTDKQELIEPDWAMITKESIRSGAFTKEQMPKIEERVHWGSRVNSKWQSVSPDTRRWGVFSPCFTTVIWGGWAVMKTLGRMQGTQGWSRLPGGSTIVQLRVALPQGRWAVRHVPSRSESGYFPSICLLLSNQTRHHLSRVLGEKHHQLVVHFRPSLCQCILNYLEGLCIPLLLYSEKMICHLLCIREWAGDAGRHEPCPWRAQDSWENWLVIRSLQCTVRVLPLWLKNINIKDPVGWECKEGAMKTL